MIMAKKKEDKVATGGGISEGVAEYFTFVGNVFDEPNRDFSDYMSPPGLMALKRKLKKIKEDEAREKNRAKQSPRRGERRGRGRPSRFLTFSAPSQLLN
jgi:hypothetical protein